MINLTPNNMDNGTKTAYPHHDKERGLSKREHFAGLALSGLLANEEFFGTQSNTYIVEVSVEMADALLIELEK